MLIPYFHVDAFTSRPFGGNPAGVCLLDAWLTDDAMQRIAAENNLAETAFVIAQGPAKYQLRWFSPTLEVDLCGHATLAAAHVLWRHQGEKAEVLRFHTLSGVLTVAREGELLLLDFPARPAQTVAAPDDVAQALGAVPQFCGQARDYLMVYESAEQLRALRADSSRILAWDTFGVIVTAPGEGYDFASRFFVPRAGVLEDSATGSSHCTLVPYWAGRLGRNKLSARQLSARGGEFECELAGERVRIGGRAVTYLTAQIEI
jgi:PhzF family phenazine biosynthesis protein